MATRPRGRPRTVDPQPKTATAKTMANPEKKRGGARPNAGGYRKAHTRDELRLGTTINERIEFVTAILDEGVPTGQIPKLLKERHDIEVTKATVNLDIARALKRQVERRKELEGELDVATQRYLNMVDARIESWWARIQEQEAKGIFDERADTSLRNWMRERAKLTQLPGYRDPLVSQQNNDVKVFINWDGAAHAQPASTGNVIAASFVDAPAYPRLPDGVDTDDDSDDDE